jgi:hypothetical protein
MPAVAHIGIGFAAKRIAPKIPVLYLILAAEFIEIIFMILWAAGIEHPSKTGVESYSPFSHSLVMGILWSVFAGLITLLITRNRRTSLIIGLLVLSHTALDIIASPKTAFYPDDTGMPVFFNHSLTIGLGLWKSKTIGMIGEYGTLIAGLAIYLYTVIKIRKEKKKAGLQQSSQ